MHDRNRKPLARKASKSVQVPFRRELIAVQKQYEHMTSAIDGRDPARVRVTACHLVLAWLQVEAAFIRFIERSPAGLGLGPQARQERFALSESNDIVRASLRRALGEMLRWNVSADESRILREILCWLHERLGLCSVVGFPDLSSPHALPFLPPSTGSRGRASRSRVRKPTRKL